MLNRLKSNYLVLIIILIAFVFMMYKSCEIYLDSEDAAVESCVLSIKSALINTIESKNEVRQLINPNQEWKLLSRAERNLLFISVEDVKDFDCGRFRSFKKGNTEDVRDFQIFIRKVNNKIDLIIKE